jgi:hypothetical protein
MGGISASSARRQNSHRDALTYLSRCGDRQMTSHSRSSQLKSWTAPSAYRRRPARRAFPSRFPSRVSGARANQRAAIVSSSLSSLVHRHPALPATRSLTGVAVPRLSIRRQPCCRRRQVPRSFAPGRCPPPQRARKAGPTRSWASRRASPLAGRWRHLEATAPPRRSTAGRPNCRWQLACAAAVRLPLPPLQEREKLPGKKELETPLLARGLTRLNRSWSPSPPPPSRQRESGPFAASASRPKDCVLPRRPLKKVKEKRRTRGLCFHTFFFTFCPKT